MNILMISSEASPYSKPSGLADVVNGLARALYFQQEQDVRIIMPLYRGIFKPGELTLVMKDLDVPMNYYSRTANLWKISGPPQVYFLQHEFYFERDALYGYLDDYERFIFFTRAVLKAVGSEEFKRSEQGWFPEILHGFNALTGLMPAWLSELAKENRSPSFDKTRFVLTLHNLDTPGVYGERALLISDQEGKGIYDDLGETSQQINFLGRSLAFADRVVMFDPDYGSQYNPLPRPLMPFNTLLQARRSTGELCPIPNGIDVESYSPAHDKALTFPFTDYSLPKRQENKLAFQSQAGLGCDANIPLLGMIGRLQTSRGYFQLEALKETLLDTGKVQLVILGEPQNRRIEQMLDAWEMEWKARNWDGKQRWFKLYPDFHDALARQIYGSCDMLLIPAFELPSSTQQYIAMHYGAIPVVNRTGALYNSIEPYTPQFDLKRLNGDRKGVGFAYSGNGPNFLKAVQDALELYHQNPKTWRDIQRLNMGKDFSWKLPAGLYLDLYQDVINDKRREIPQGKELEKGSHIEPYNRLLQAVREIDRLPGMRGRDLRYMLKHAARLVRWVLQCQDVYIWVSEEYLLPGEEPAGGAPGVTEEPAFMKAGDQEKMRVVSSLWRDAPSLPEEQRKLLEAQAEVVLEKIAGRDWPTASDWLPGDEPPLSDLCQPINGLENETVTGTKGWGVGWSAIIASHSRVMGRIDVLFSKNTSDIDQGWVTSALSTLASSFGLRMETVRFAMEKDQSLELAARLVDAQSLQQVLTGVRQAARQLSEAQQAWVYIWNGQALEPEREVSPTLAKACQAYAEKALAREAVVYVRDWDIDVGKDQLPDSHLRTLMAVPMLRKGNQSANEPVGVLFVASDRPAAFSQDQQRWLTKTLAPQAAAVLRTFIQLQQKQDRLTESARRLDTERVVQLQHLAASLVVGGDFPQLLASVVATTRQELKAETASIYLFDPDQKKLVLQAAYGYHSKLVKPNGEAPNYEIGKGITGWLATQNEVYRPASFQEMKEHPSYLAKYLDEIDGREPNAFLGIPLIIQPGDPKKRQVIGVMKVEDRPKGVEPAFSREDELLAQMMGNVIATVVHNMQVSQNQLSSLRASLAELSIVLAGGSDRNTLLQGIVQTIANLMGAAASSLYLVDENTGQLVIEAAAGYQAVLLSQGVRPSYARGQGVTGWIWEQGEKFKADNYDELRGHPSWKGKQDEVQGKIPSSFLGLPLTVTDRYTNRSKVIGVLKVEDVRITPKHPEDHFTLQDELLVTMMANVIATVVYNTQVGQNQLTNLRTSLNELSKVLVAASDIPTLLQKIVETIAQLMGASASSLYLVDRTTDQLVIHAAAGYQRKLLKGERKSYTKGEGVTGWIWEQARLFRADNYTELKQHPAWKGKQDEAQGMTPASFLGLPLTVTNRWTNQIEVIGVLKMEDIRNASNHPENYFTDQDVALATMMGTVIATVVYNAQTSREQLESLGANIGTLTDALSAGDSMETLVKQVVETICRVLNAKAASLYLVDKAADRLVIQAATGYQAILLNQAERPTYNRGQGVTGWIWDQGEKFKANNYQELHNHPNWKGKQDDVQGKIPSSFLGLPLKVKKKAPSDQPGVGKSQEEVIGVLKVEDIQATVDKHPEAYFTDLDELLVTMMGNVIASVIETARNGEKRVGELLESMGPEILFGSSARAMLGSFCQSSDEGIIDQLAEVIAAQMDRSPERFLQWAQELYEAGSNRLLYRRVALRARSEQVRQRFQLLYSACGLSSEYENWQALKKVIQPWMALQDAAGQTESATIALKELLTPLAAKMGLKDISMNADSVSNWIGAFVETDPHRQPLVQKLFPRVLIAALRAGELNLEAWRRLQAFAHRHGETQLVLCLNWRENMSEQARIDLRKDADLRKTDIVLLGVSDLMRVEREPDAPAQLRNLVTRQMTGSSLFIKAGPVPEEMFFGRRDEKNYLLAHLQASDFALVGNRQIGKTSLMHEVWRRLKKTTWAYPIKVDCQGPKTIEQFLEKLQSELDPYLMDELSLVEMEASLKKIRQQRLPILFLDEVDRLVEADLKGSGLLLDQFRSMANAGICHFVFGGSQLLARQLSDASRNLYNFAERRVIGLLTEAEGRETLLKPLDMMDISLENPDDCVKKILRITSRHPNLIQVAGDWLTSRALGAGGRRITLADVEMLTRDNIFLDTCLEKLWGVADKLEKLITLIIPDEGFSKAELENWLDEKQVSITAIQLDEALKALAVYSLLIQENWRYYLMPEGFKDLLPQQEVERYIRQYIEDLQSPDSSQGA
ncbi:MAG: GAF domain-containing protein [Anaerolineales bacterium]|nr:GAF domain-containing protein [Anaerolineales bacterium]